jgi:hypothetical protein
MKNWKIIALICAIVFAGVSVKLPWAVVWIPVIATAWLVLSDKELMKKWNDFMNQMGA